LRFEV